MSTTGRIVTVYGNMVTAEFEGSVRQNAVAYCQRTDGVRLMSEIIRVRGKRCDMQVFELTRGLKVGDAVEITDELLSVELGPGLIGMIYDGLQNPLPEMAEKVGKFLEPGHYLKALDRAQQWEFAPVASVGDTVSAAENLGKVKEKIFDHYIMAPFTLNGEWKVKKVAAAGKYKVEDEIAVLEKDGETVSVNMIQRWPVRMPLGIYNERLLPTEPMVTKQRIIDTFFPVMLGGTYCIPGPFGAGKTVLQQITSRHAEIDLVIVAACGERAGEVVETLREFPHLKDPRTGKTLIERTIIICNTSSMPVAARESSVYTAITLGEYYRQVGLNVLLLADSTSRWAQALREMSGRLEEIPGEEAFPAYLESSIARFYERGGIVELKDGRKASLTVGGTVSPAGGNFEEPVTQGTLKVVGAFLGLSYARSYARRFPAIDPLESWSKYSGTIAGEKVAWAHAFLRRGKSIFEMMQVVGEEGTSIDDFVIYLKSEFLDNVYLQQNSFDEVDAACPTDRQEHLFEKVCNVLKHEFVFADKAAARDMFFTLTEQFRNWNYAPWQTDRMKEAEAEISKSLSSKEAAHA
ncbi:MAG: V-type ATP synthase subunit A [Candidatus Riflebacteria bacterium HGW-Riflebacteria-1]|nr:MAG: V-type ATP synthase subunit A [Candidatus Riflebacteria bacterium HGW-Riflebacteria-1]